MTFWGQFTTSRRDWVAVAIIAGWEALAWAGFTGRLAPILAGLGVVGLGLVAWALERR